MFAALFTSSACLSDAQVFTQGRIQELDDRVYSDASVWLPKLLPVIQGYYKAVVEGDAEAVLARYDWFPVQAQHMGSRQRRVLQIAEFVKEQIADNGGLRRVNIVSVFDALSFSDDEVNVIVELEFNDGNKDISFPLRMSCENPKRQWGLSAYEGFPVVGMHEALNVVEGIYLGGLKGDLNQIADLIYLRDLHEVPEERKSEFVKLACISIMENVKDLIPPNGGLASIDARNAFGAEVSISDLSSGGIALRARMEYTLIYNNGKGNRIKVFLIFDEGRWKRFVW